MQSIRSTPACLNRANSVRAEAARRNHKHYKFLGMNVPPVFYDLYINRAQRQFMLYFILHIAGFAVIFYRHQTYGPKAEPGKTLGTYYSLLDEILCFCYYPAFAILYFRDVRTVSKWEFLALVVSWVKSAVVLVETKRSNFTKGVGFPDNTTDYVVFGIVRFLVFGGFYKVVQAGLRKSWEWEHVEQKPIVRTRVRRLHRPRPPRLRTRTPARRARRFRPARPHSLETEEEREAYWHDIKSRGW